MELMRISSRYVGRLLARMSLKPFRTSSPRENFFKLVKNNFFALVPKFDTPSTPADYCPLEWAVQDHHQNHSGQVETFNGKTFFLPMILLGDSILTKVLPECVLSLTLVTPLIVFHGASLRQRFAHLNFPRTLITWVMKCVKSPTFFVLVYLFCTVMEFFSAMVYEVAD